MIAHSDLAYVIDPRGHPLRARDGPRAGDRRLAVVLLGVSRRRPDLGRRRFHVSRRRGQPPTRRRRDLLVGVAGVVVVAAGATGCSNQSSSLPDPAATPPAAVPLATSMASTVGTWVVLPMGHLHDPENTFWQMLFEPTGSTTWSNQVEATAVATNGGVVLAATPGGAVIAGVRPANKLRYSPLVVTTDGVVRGRRGFSTRVSPPTPMP